jgi:hypothetical protein
MLTKVSAGVLNIDDLFGFRNRIINGDMRISQRGTAAVTANAEFPVDRYKIQYSFDGAISAQQDSSAPTGFVNSTKITVTTADASLGTSQFALFRHFIEGTNVSDLAWGSASAKTVTLSFWVRSSLTGTFGGSLNNSANNRSYPFSYTISVADTWEQKFIIIAGETSGTWLTTTGVGIRINWSLGAGTDFLATAGSWVNSEELGATGQTNVLGTLNATWYITGVQLEVGSVATPFERRPFGMELALCQRYFYNYPIFNLFAWQGWAFTTNNGSIRLPIPITMRTEATATISGSVGDNTKDWTIYNNGAYRTVTSIVVENATLNSVRVNIVTSSGLAGSDAFGLYASNTDGGAKLTLSAEL